MKRNLWIKEIKVFADFFLLMCSVELVQWILGLPTYDFFYLLLITGLLTIGDSMDKVRFFCFGIAFFLLDLSPGILLVPLALFFLKIKAYSPFDILFNNIWMKNNQKKMV